MAAVSHRPTPERDAVAEPAPTRLPVLSALALIATLLAFLGVGIVIRDQGGSTIGTTAGAVVTGLGLLFIVPAMTRVFALLLVWNAVGIATGLFAVGLVSVGALLAVPLALLVFALVSWPSTLKLPALSLPAVIAQVGGFALVILVALERDDLWARIVDLWP